MLSALFVVSSMIAIYTGIAYTLYLDMVVPLFVCLIYMRLDLRHTLLSSITSLLIVTFAIGDVASAIWMSQGILMGLICGYFIRKNISETKIGEAKALANDIIDKANKDSETIKKETGKRRL